MQLPDLNVQVHVAVQMAGDDLHRIPQRHAEKSVMRAPFVGRANEFSLQIV
jgi:hypothetical protein